MYYSKGTGGFYSEKIHGEKIPSDAVEITDAEYSALLHGQSTGFEIISDVDGKPFLRASVADRGEEIKARLAQIDALAVRPMRAMLAGTGGSFDISALTNLEIEAQSLREEAKTL